MKQPLFDKRSIASAITVLAILLVSCGKPSVGESDLTLPRNEIPAVVTENVNTLISDSGITRYRIETPEWLVFDKTDTPYQEFPKGIYLEQFAMDLSVQASLKADYAHYNENTQQWTLIGNVHALNREGEQFDTQNLNWDQKEHRVYTDSLVRIVRANGTYTGIHFVSNEEMSKYSFDDPKGEFLIEE